MMVNGFGRLLTLAVALFLLTASPVGAQDQSQPLDETQFISAGRLEIARQLPEKAMAAAAS